MAHNFLTADREQLYLMPPSVTEWLPEDHLAWFVLEIIDELDVSAFEAAYREDGRGGAAYHPRVMLALLVYAYCSGERSSRRIERRCVEDVAYRVVCANQSPDHATIARFRAAHQVALGALFAQVLRLCAEAGLVQAALVAIDGTRMEADAAKEANRTAEELAAEILEEAAATDAAEDEQFGDARGDELPERWRRREGRRQRIREALDKLEAEREKHSYEAVMARRQAQEAKQVRPLRGRKPKPDAKKRWRQRANTTDPNSRLLSVRGGFVQGYNAQAAATPDQVVVAAEVTEHSGDAVMFVPMIDAVTTNLAAAGVHEPVGTVVADAGYWSKDNATLEGPEVLIATTKATKLKRLNPVTTEDRLARWRPVMERLDAGEITGVEAGRQMKVSRSTALRWVRQWREKELLSERDRMEHRLATDAGRELYSQRSRTIEPIFGQTKHSRGMRRFMRRGLAACDSEWKLIMATHNLRKLWKVRRPGMPAFAS